MRRLALILLILTVAAASSGQEPAQSDPTVTDDQGLRELVITGTPDAHVTPLAVLPSLSSDYSDVVLRGVVRRDLELSGLFRVIADSKAPPGLYGFSDPVDFPEWKKLGAEVVVKVAAQPLENGQVEILGLAYFVGVSKDPVYEKRFAVPKNDVRRAAHRVTDALLGAITGRPGSFASHMTFADRWGRSSAIFTMDADGHDLKRVTPDKTLSIAPAWGPDAKLYYSASKHYAPFDVFRAPETQLKNPFNLSIYGTAFDAENGKVAYAVAERGGSAIFVGPIATLTSVTASQTAFTKVSNTKIATHPAFGPDGELAWVGGNLGSVRRIYVDGRAVSPPGMTAVAPTFCGGTDGTRLVYAVRVAANTYDLVSSAPNGSDLRRLTQGQGSNTYPACSPDGRLVAFFSTRHGSPGLYLLSLKTMQTHKVTSRTGQSLQWGPLPEQDEAGNPDPELANSRKGRLHKLRTPRVSKSPQMPTVHEASEAARKLRPAVPSPPEQPSKKNPASAPALRKPDPQ